MFKEAYGTAQRTLSARIARQVMEAAEQGLYKPSERLPSERELAELLTVSRTTVTAAYADLEQQGLIRRIQGKGAYLCALPESEGSFSWSGKISRSANALDQPILELLARRCADQIPYPLSVGTPALDIFPREDFAESTRRTIEGCMPSALGIGLTEGQWELRTALAGWLDMRPENIMITAGAQESIDLLARCLIEPGDFVVADSPVYPGALQSFLSAGARVLSWNVAWSIGQLEDLLLRFRPKLIFTIPNFNNPTGRVMPMKTRLALLELAKRYRVPIVEDDVYGRTAFSRQVVPGSLYKLDNSSHVIHFSTFSKMLAPGLRVGWLAGPLYMIKQLTLIKMRSNLFTGGFHQLVLADMITRGHMDRHLSNLRQHHQSLCAAALDALLPSMERGLISCRVPTGGLYLWCKLRFAADEERLIALLEEQGVSVAPGSLFRAERDSTAIPALRLCFTAASRTTLARGIEILNRVLRQVHSLTSAQHSSMPSFNNEETPTNAQAGG